MTEEETEELEEKQVYRPAAGLLTDAYLSPKSALEIAQTQLLQKIFSERRALDQRNQANLTKLSVKSAENRDEKSREISRHLKAEQAKAEKKYRQ